MLVQLRTRENSTFTSVRLFLTKVAQMSAAVTSSSCSASTLTSADIPGANLKELFETHAVPALRWWLLSRGIKASAWRKKQLIDR